jgi:hypothetical protein
MLNVVILGEISELGASSCVESSNLRLATLCLNPSGFVVKCCDISHALCAIAKSFKNKYT